MKFQIDEKLLQPKLPIDNFDWKIWQKKNLNLHRGLIETNLNSSKPIDEFAKEIRIGVLKEFKPCWFRGFAFGVIVHCNYTPDEIEKISVHVDKRNKKNGVWQWVIFCNDKDKTARGVHTWMHGYLRPIYESIFEDLKKNGYECFFKDTEMDKGIEKLMKAQEYLSITHWVIKFIKFLFRK